MSFVNKKWLYVARPEGRVSSDNYALVTETIDSTSLASNEVIVKMDYISVDPYMRIQQAARDTWEAPHPLNTVQGAGTIGHVVATASANFQVGDYVIGYHGWQKYVKCHCGEVKKLDTDIAQMSVYLGILGMPGRTAWFGLMESGRPRPGETVVVSGAAGAVGSLVVQYAKLAGCKVYGIAGGTKKCEFLVNTLGLDGAIDYKSFSTLETMSAEIKRITGTGVDVYFDNVGGYITDAILMNIKLRARVIICGQISQYDGGLDQPQLGPRLLQHLLFQRATIQGILQ
ncbi:NADP-dependent oxidoreductase [archaeon]|nr:MAG: NADP-dependent oxidoreductase [archaeon]